MQSRRLYQKRSKVDKIIYLQNFSSMAALDLSNREFIENLLKKPITSHSVGEGCNKGDNVAGSLKSITATTDSGQTISAVYKFFPPKDSPTYTRIKERQVFRTECTAYTELASVLEEFVNARIDGPNKYGLPIPKLYSHFNDDENDYICLEDVRPQGYVMPIIFTGLGYPETSLVLQELARFHAYTYALIRYHGEKLFHPEGQFARFNFKKWRSGDNVKEWHAMISGSVQNATDIIQEINPQLGRVMQEKIPAEKAGSFIDALRVLTDVNYFPCIAHGDFWSNNVLIKYDAQNPTKRKPLAVKFIDFQFTRRGNIFEDLLYFFFTSTDTAFRKEHLTRVLLEYHGSFKSALKAINFPMPVNFTSGFLIENFNSLAKASLVYMCFAIPLQMGKPIEVVQQPEEEIKSIGNGENHGNHAKDSENSCTESIPEDPKVVGLKVFIQNLRKMVVNSPPALKRIQEITEEVLVSGMYQFQ